MDWQTFSQHATLAVLNLATTYLAYRAGKRNGRH